MFSPTRNFLSFPGSNNLFNGVQHLLMRHLLIKCAVAKLTRGHYLEVILFAVNEAPLFGMGRTEAKRAQAAL
jgi:hypothetical protein